MWEICSIKQKKYISWSRASGNDLTLQEKTIKIIPYFENVNIGYLRLIFEPREDIWWVRITRFY